MWIVPQEVKDETVTVLNSISTDTNISARDRIKAAEVLGKLEAQNTPAALHQHLHVSKADFEQMTFEEKREHLKRRIAALQMR